MEELLAALEEVHGRPRYVARFDPMEELVSCIMSQHTTDANSFPAFTRLRETFPEWSDVVPAGPARVADVIRKAGLANQKSKSIVGCLNAIRDRTGGYSIDFLRDLPMAEARRWLESLPGVGPKTASIVLCFSFGMGAIPVDTHVYRVSQRLGIIPETMAEGKAHDALLKIVPPESAFRFHADLIQHGRLICRAPVPDCGACPVRDACRWYRKGGPERRRRELEQARRRGKAHPPESRKGSGDGAVPADRRTRVPRRSRPAETSGDAD
ncbi:MAG: endonuclease III [Fimbriimonadaceae bacterium]